MLLGTRRLGVYFEGPAFYVESEPRGECTNGTYKFIVEVPVTRQHTNQRPLLLEQLIVGHVLTRLTNTPPFLIPKLIICFSEAAVWLYFEGPKFSVDSEPRQNVPVTRYHTDLNHSCLTS